MNRKKLCDKHLTEIVKVDDKPIEKDKVIDAVNNNKCLYCDATFYNKYGVDRHIKNNCKVLKNYHNGKQLKNNNEVSDYTNAKNNNVIMNNMVKIYTELLSLVERNTIMWMIYLNSILLSFMAQIIT